MSAGSGSNGTEPEAGLLSGKRTRPRIFFVFFFVLVAVFVFWRVCS